MALTRWPTEPHPWLLPWEIWKLRGEPKGQRPVNAPARIPAYAKEFHIWVAGGARTAHRPPGHHQDHPQVGVRVLKQVMVAVPLIPPPPPPPPANPDPPDSLAASLPDHVHVVGAGRWSGATDAGIDNCVAAGIRTIALQGGQFTGRDAQRCRDKGLKVAVWGSPSSNDQAYPRSRRRRRLHRPDRDAGGGAQRDSQPRQPGWAGAGRSR